MKPLTDNGGYEIRTGDTVRQVNEYGTPHYDAAAGALLTNAGQTGTVVGLGRTRVKVDFGRTKTLVFGRTGTNESVIDNVHTSMLVVVPTPASEGAIVTPLEPDIGTIPIPVRRAEVHHV